MTTLDQSLTIQKTDNVLYAPTISGPGNLHNDAAAASGTLTVSLYNSTNSNTVYAYITGLAINNNNAVCLIESDGQTVYYPSNPSSNGSPLQANCSIALGPVGSTTNVTIPYIAGGRIWFCVENTLTFLLNQGSNGPGLVEPSVSNTSDPNYNYHWDFCEFTYNSAQIYANISYVDFVCLPIALTLTSSSSAVYHVGGLPSNGLDTICSNLVSQNNSDGAGWNELVITQNGSNLRALSPTNGIVMNNSLFENYWTDYINQVFNMYATQTLAVDTQAQWGTVTGNTSNDRTQLVFSGAGSFNKPAAADIFGAASGAFAAQPNNTAELLNIGARLDAAFNRSTLLIDTQQPDGENPSNYYKNSITNHYARIVHAANVDGRGYCFPYDDVTPNGGTDQSGFVADPTPSNFLVTVGGGNAYSRRSGMAFSPVPVNPSMAVAKPKYIKRSLGWEQDVKEPVSQSDVDLEQGLHPKLLNEMSITEPAASQNRLQLPPAIERLFGKYLSQLRDSPFYTTKVQPLVQLINQALVFLLSLSVRAVLSRVFILAFVLIFYFLGIMPRNEEIDSQRRMLEAAGLINGGQPGAAGL